MKDRRNLGFTLIELLVVIAIIGVLAAIAVPSYRSYLDKITLVEAVSFAESLKAEVEEEFALTGGFPHSSNRNSVGGDVVSFYQYWSPGTYQTAAHKVIWVHVYIQDGVYPGATNTHAVLLEGKVVGGAVQWSCGPHPNRPIPAKYLPSNCREILAAP